MEKLYAVTATVRIKQGKGYSTRQVPTFYLNADTQGIVNVEHAKRIAESVINADGKTVIAYCDVQPI